MRLGDATWKLQYHTCQPGALFASLCLLLWTKLSVLEFLILWYYERWSMQAIHSLHETLVDQVVVGQPTFMNATSRSNFLLVWPCVKVYFLQNMIMFFMWLVLLDVYQFERWHVEYWLAHVLGTSVIVVPTIPLFIVPLWCVHLQILHRFRLWYFLFYFMIISLFLLDASMVQFSFNNLSVTMLVLFFRYM